MKRDFHTHFTHIFTHIAFVLCGEKIKILKESENFIAVVENGCSNFERLFLYHTLPLPKIKGRKASV